MSNEIANRGTNDNKPTTVPAVGLSDAGVQRRDAMLSALQGAVVREGGRRRARRIAVRRAGSVCLVAVMAVSVVVGWPAFQSDDSVVDHGKIAQVAQDSGGIVRLRSAPGALERYAYAAPVDLAGYIVDDAALVATLASIGRPSGLMHRGGRVTLTSFKPDPIRLASAETQNTDPAP